MKNLANKLMVVAAAMAAVAGTVSAQSMKAEVPFSFKVSGTVMPAGTYMVTAAHHTSGNRESVDHLCASGNSSS